jgi:PAS domain S-box-containing protein
MLSGNAALGSDLLQSGGECGTLIRAYDWGQAGLGPIQDWTPELRATVSNVINSPVAKVLMWGPDHIMIYNDAYSLIAGPHHPAAIGGKVPEVWPEIWDWNSRILEAGFRGEILSYRDQPMTLVRDGVAEQLTFDLFYTPIYEAGGAVGGVLCTVVENTEKAAAQREVARMAMELKTVTDALPVLIAFLDRDHIYHFANSYYRDWLGVDPAQIIGRHARDIVGERVYSARLHLIERAMAGEAVVADTFMPHRDGSERTAEVRYIPRRNFDGEVDGIHVLVFDVEDRVRRQEDLEQQVRQRQHAEDQLRQLNETLEARIAEALEERRLAEVSLAQAQKMETIGKLTGGVAHDFNNLLQVVSGNLQLVAKDVPADSKAATRIANALAGVSRGAKLASQLLAFGRRQALEPKVVNLTRLVREIDDMLRRAIGDGIEVETVVGGGLWNTLIDPGKVENAILNLAINARDAMEGQGRLTIELGNALLDDDYARKHEEVSPGQYVMLAVTDTGVGMPPELLEKVFEPFFSTKAEGRGSGLGLSMVYGFVKQSGGHIKIYSEVGHGTTVKLYLPRAMGAEDVEVAVDLGAAIGGPETILVVEDDADVRHTVIEMLSDLGYRVLRASDADSALSVIESGVPIDLLFTDVVMPGALKSPELARRASERLPDIAVLFTSGYTENAIVHGGRLDPGVELLGKPYTREQLARKLRHVLTNQRERNLARMDAAVSAGRDGETPGAQVLPGLPAGLSVLLVEDDELIRVSTAMTLADLGVSVAEATSGEEAIAMLQGQSFDVIVTDVNLPGMSGDAFAARARELYPTIGVIFATGDGLATPGAPRAITLQKPYTAADLGHALIAAQVTPERG